MESIYKITNHYGEELGLIKVPSFLDILDVEVRAKNMYGEDIDYPIYLGDVC